MCWISCCCCFAGTRSRSVRSGTVAMLSLAAARRGGSAAITTFCTNRRNIKTFGKHPNRWRFRTTHQTRECIVLFYMYIWCCCVHCIIYRYTFEYIYFSSSPQIGCVFAARVCLVVYNIIVEREE